MKTAKAFTIVMTLALAANTATTFLHAMNGNELLAKTEVSVTTALKSDDPYDLIPVFSQEKTDKHYFTRLFTHHFDTCFGKFLTAIFNTQNVLTRAILSAAQKADAQAAPWTSKFVQKLIEQYSQQYGETALTMAAKYSTQEATQLILDTAKEKKILPAVFAQRDSTEKTALEHARTNNPTMAAFLASYAKMNIPGWVE